MAGNVLFAESVDVQNAHLLDDRTFAGLTGTQQQQPMCRSIYLFVLLNLFFDSLVGLSAPLLLVLIIFGLRPSKAAHHIGQQRRSALELLWSQLCTRTECTRVSISSKGSDHRYNRPDVERIDRYVLDDRVFLFVAKSKMVDQTKMTEKMNENTITGDSNGACKQRQIDVATEASVGLIAGKRNRCKMIAVLVAVVTVDSWTVELDTVMKTTRVAFVWWCVQICWKKRKKTCALIDLNTATKS